MSFLIIKTKMLSTIEENHLQASFPENTRTSEFYKQNVVIVAIYD